MLSTDHIGPLLENLIKTYNHGSTQVDVEQQKRSALKVFGSDNSPRTNQFEVKARLEGLVEKCRILNKDPLADALQSRLDEISAKSDKWTPEILSLLLHLSDRPVQKSRAEDLISLDSVAEAAPLTWSDIVDEDPVEDASLWRDVDFAVDGSDEEDDVEETILDASESEEDPSTPQLEDLEETLDSLIVSVEKHSSSGSRDLRYWRKKRSMESRAQESSADEPRSLLLLTELQVIREVAFMLLGLPNSMFLSRPGEPWTVLPEVGIRHVSDNMATNLLNKFTDIGNKLSLVRRWIKREESIPLVQTFQVTLSSRLRKFENVLHTVQARILDVSQPYTVSLLEVYEVVYNASRHIEQLYPVLLRLDQSPESQRPFQILECLYDRTCVNHSVGNAESYEYTGVMFFECFQTYLRSIRTWMETGHLEPNDPVMFVRRNENELPLDSIWKDQFSLIRDPDGNIHAPRFLHVASKKIFNTGKSVDFLNRLGYEHSETNLRTPHEPQMTFQSVCASPDPNMLSPFPELFDAALSNWITSRHHSSSTLLRQQLESRCSLQTSFDALEHIYFSRNGALTASINLPLFSNIDTRKNNWPDPITLTSLHRTAFASTPSIDPSRLTVRTNSPPPNRKPRSTSPLSSLQLTYTLPWPIANILPPPTQKTYQRIHTLLTLLHHSSHLLHLPLPKSHPSLPPQVTRLRLRLLWFTSTLLTHLTTLVLDASTTAMRAEMRSAEDVDAMIEVHENYVRRVEGGCFLTEERGGLRRAVVAVLNLVILSKGGVRAEEGGDGDASVGVVSDLARMGEMEETFDRLLAFITASVQGISKADNALCWEILAANLAAGGGR